MPTFAEYLEKWLAQSTVQGLTNPLVKMPVKRFRLLQEHEYASLAGGGSLTLGTMSDPIARNLYKNYQTRIRERGEHCAYICSGSIEMVLAGAIDGKQRRQLFPVCLKRASLSSSSERVKVLVSEDESWRLNPLLQAHLRSLAISVPASLADDPIQATNWLKAQLGNRASQIADDSYVGLFSSQQMVVQARLADPLLRRALARNPIIQAKVAGEKLAAVDLGEITDDGLEELGLVLPCDDSQLRVIQLSHGGHSLQVEGPPGTGKSQTIANIISNALLHGRRVLLVCDKKAAIVQVEERLSNVGLKPAMLNLHDEELDKREFLRQATDKFHRWASGRDYPISQLKESRQTLNERVRFARSLAHPSLQVTMREAMAGLIQLRKELKYVPSIPIASWQSLSKDRLNKLLGCIGEWPELGNVLTDNRSIWNSCRVDRFDANPNAANELQRTIERILTQLASLEAVSERAAAVGMELPLHSDEDVARMLALVVAVLGRPACHPHLAGNPLITLAELHHLRSQWVLRDALLAARHPIDLSPQFSSVSTESAQRLAEREAEELLRAEGAISWDDLGRRASVHDARHDQIEKLQAAYRQICASVGLVYSPLLSVRKVQLEAALSLASFGTTIPRGWWRSDTQPIVAVEGWKAQLLACAFQAKNSPLPLHFVALERIATTHLQHLEAKAEHGFNLVSYCLHFVNDRKCKYALRQVFPSLPSRGFRQWQDLTLQAVTAFHQAQSLRASADAHPVLKQLTSSYLAVAHEEPSNAESYVSRTDVRGLDGLAARTEQLRGRSDLFDVESVHWQAFWEFPSAALLAAMRTLLSDLDVMATSGELHSDDLEQSRDFHKTAEQRISSFLQDHIQRDGDRTNAVLDSFAARRNYADCQTSLAPLASYLALQVSSQSQPDWPWLESVIKWRDTFEQLRGQQKLDIDSSYWITLRDRLGAHQALLTHAYGELDGLFESSHADRSDYSALTANLREIQSQMPQRALWLEKKRWQEKIGAFPEIRALWTTILDGSVKPEQGRQLFCFNLLHLCDPVAKPHGGQLKQVLKGFAEQDDNLATWVLTHLVSGLIDKMHAAAEAFASSESELRRLAGLQRVRGTVRELISAHQDYLLAAKSCWLMSPTSLANLLDSSVFDSHGAPFDVVIFDEASQIRVLDGLLSMSFGKQVIIVGDKNQLPPTDFFASFASPETDFEDFGVSESLLEEFGGVFEEGKTHVMLMSHYRSETPDLIGFSNGWFYGGNLEMYPPAHVSGIGRRLHYLADAIYSSSGQRHNEAEAREVVKLVELHVRESPSKSLGVVTMNIPQMELIDQLLLSAPEPVRAFCSDEARFFLRNLETVQGDEMDRIILSLTYGKDATGKFNAAVLGPLNKSGGERRLNVAITRSRSGLVVVSSLKVADLDATGASSRGFRCLQAFLSELEQIDRSRAFGIGSKRFERRADGVSNIVFCESPFEEQVVEFLENEGYEIECQYGAGKYRIDIIVKEKGKNILALECDGAAYHSSLVARTRDRARQRELESRGWRIHRVWSTNWWHFEEQEKEGILAAISAARAPYPAPPAARP